MGEAYLFGTGGGDKLKTAFAIINVKYPAGSSLTCTNKETGKTYTAGNSYGAWAFGVNSAGTWNVTAARGENIKGFDVVVVNKGDIAEVEIIYKLELYVSGVNHPEFGFTSNAGSNMTVEFQTDKVYYHAGWQQDFYFYTKKKIDLSKYSKVYVRASNSGLSVHISNGTSSVAALGNVSADGKYYDISAQNGTNNIMLYHYNPSQTTKSGDIYEVWLE